MPPKNLPAPPGAVPPRQARIVELRPEPWPDGHRMRVHLTLTPALENPNVVVAIYDPAGQEVASIAIVEAFEEKIVFTMHIRAPLASEAYTLTARLEYPEIGVVDEKTTRFTTQENIADES